MSVKEGDRLAVMVKKATIKTTSGSATLLLDLTSDPDGDLSCRVVVPDDMSHMYVPVPGELVVIECLTVASSSYSLYCSNKWRIVRE